MTKDEFEELERELLHAADTWFNQALHLKLQRLIEIAKLGRKAIDELAALRYQPPETADRAL